MSNITPETTDVATGAETHTADVTLMVGPA